VIGNMGMTVAQAQTRQQAATNADNNNEILLKRLRGYLDRQDALTRQGDERIGLAKEALGLRKAGAGGKGPRSAKPQMSSMSDTDLVTLILGK